MHKRTSMIATRVLLASGALLLAALLATGCEQTAPEQDTGGVGTKAVPPVVPSSFDTSTPEGTVKSYTDLISYMYRISNTERAWDVMTGYEEVRVNSYAQYSKSEKNQAIEQFLYESDYVVRSQEATRAVVAGTERWRYRYIDYKKQVYSTGPLKASYDVTYTVVYEKPKGWLVDKVEAKSLGEVK